MCTVCWNYLRKEVLIVSHAVRAHLWTTAAVAMGLYAVGTWAYHWAKAFNLIGG